MDFGSGLIALCAGLSCGCFFVAAARMVAAARDEAAPAPEDLRLPLLLRLGLPLRGLARRLAESPSAASWREAEAPRLWMAGVGEVFTPADFVAVKLVFIGIGILFFLFGLLTGHELLCTLIAGLLAFYPGLWISAVIRKRQLSIMKALPNVLDLLTLSVESGRDLLSALRDILERRKSDPLSEELMRAFREIQFGRKRSEALQAMARRVRQTDLTATVNAIVQAEELGVSIANSLRIQSDMQRAKRFALAEKLANEAAVKIVLPVVAFILPAVFIILLGPIVMQAARVFGG